MLVIAKLGAGTARDYFKEEFAAASNSYFAEDGSVRGRWNGALAERLGLSGRVTEEQYMRLIEGQHPLTGEQLVQHRDTWRTREGLETSHVPGWDMSFGLPKSWSIAAIVGGDKRIYEIAERANQAMLAALQDYAQAHGGGSNPRITTGSWVVSTFRHETSRPVDGYSAPQIHFHNLLMNLQQTADGRFKALDPVEIYRAKSYALQVAYDVLAREGRKAGYQIDFADKTYAPEIRGISEAYREHESPREQVIKEELERLGLSSGNAAHIIAKSNREEKLDLTPEQFIAAQTEHGKPFADELSVVPDARERGPVHVERIATPQAAVTHAARSLSERLATFEHYQLGREALRYSLGTVPREAVEAEIQKRIDRGDLVLVHHYRDNAPGARYATRETLHTERETVERALAGVNAVEPILLNADLSQYRELADNLPRQQIIRNILATRDQVVALNGTAGSAKSTAAGIIREVAESRGFRVKGLAPTGTAAQSLSEKGISSDTLAMHLTRARFAEPETHRKTLYILDETSLAATRDVNAFFKTLRPQDHVLLVGDDAPDNKKVGQHTSIEAGRVFQLLQEAGIKTAHFNRVYRQKDPELKNVVLSFRHGQTEKALDLLSSQGRIHEYSNARERFEYIAKAYAESPKWTLVISPDNESRMRLNVAIRSEMRRQGQLAEATYDLAILVGRDLTLAEAQRASSYRVGDVVQYRKGNKEVGVKAREYATVLERDTDSNRLTVKTKNGVVTYDPARAAGVNVFESRAQEFSAGERVQFTAKDKKLGVNTRDTGTIRSLDQTGNAELVLDRNDRVIRFNLENNRHLDHAYSMTSHSAQSKTVERVLINVDTGDHRLRGLLNEVFAYVAASRPEYDLQVFADDASQLLQVLSRQNEQTKALAPEQIEVYRERLIGLVKEPRKEIERERVMDLGVAV